MAEQPLTKWLAVNLKNKWIEYQEEKNLCWRSGEKALRLFVKY